MELLTPKMTSLQNCTRVYRDGKDIDRWHHVEHTNAYVGCKRSLTELHCKLSKRGEPSTLTISSVVDVHRTSTRATQQATEFVFFFPTSAVPHCTAVTLLGLEWVDQTSTILANQPQQSHRYTTESNVSLNVSNSILPYLFLCVVILQDQGMTWFS